MSKSSLRTAAEGNLLNIGTADYLVETAIPGADKPGDIINWALRLDPDAIREVYAELEKLDRPSSGTGEYQELVIDDYIDKLDQDWAGLGGNTFVSRWNKLRGYVGYTENEGRRRVLSSQIGAMADFADACDSLFEALEAGIDSKLSQVRSAYVAALVEDGDGAAMTNALAGAGLGATFGSAGGWAGIAAGAGFGAVMGLIGDFNTDVENKTPEFLGGEVGIAAIASEMEQLQNTIFLKSRGDGNKISLDYKEFKLDDEDIVGADSWEEGHEGGWKPE